MSLAPWTNKDLLDVFINLIHKAQCSAQIRFFVDGFDEFEGGDAARIDLLQLNFGFAQCQGPWLELPLAVFEDVFQAGPCLRLQQLPYKDINNYVQSRIGG